jgi:hypothetical protein
MVDMHTDTIDNDTAERIVDAYLTCWNEPDPERRAAAISDAWHDDARSVDPLADVTGHAAIADMIDGVSVQMPGHRFERRGPARAHHDVVHWAWTMFAPDGTQVLTGIDTAHVRDGRITSLFGFFDA